MKIKERALSLLLSLVMVLTFMPALTFAEAEEGAVADGAPVAEEITEAVENEEASLEEAPDLTETSPALNEISEDAYVTDIHFISVDNGDRFTFYDEINTEIMGEGPDEEYAGYFYSWKDGDKLEVTYNTGEKEILVCEERDEVLYWVVQGTSEEPRYSDPWFIDDQSYESPWGIGDHEITICYGNDEDGNAVETTITAHVLANPVSEIRFEPSENSGEQRFAFYEGEAFGFGWEEGDKVIATINGAEVEYVAKEYYDAEEECCMGFFDSNNNNPEFGYIDYDYSYVDHIEDWEIGNHDIAITYAGKTCYVTVTKKASPVTAISYIPKKSEYSEAEIRWFEYEDWRFDEATEEEHYCNAYCLDFEEGDILRVTADGETKEYTYSTIEVNEGGDMYGYDAFVDDNGETLEEYKLKNPYYAMDDVSHITAGEYTFVGSYYGREFTIDITVTPSTEEEIAVEEAKIDAVDQMHALEESINWEAYRSAQRAEIDRAIYSTIYNIRHEASSISEVNNLVSAAKSKIASIKTDAQLKAEEATAAAIAAENARQGTYDPSLPKVKASKPKAAKKAFTAKWKKLKKKQLKSGVTNIEVWACADGAFANGSTIERVVGKKKASLKLKGMQKGVTYFVKVRAIKYVGGVKYVGPWSAVKKVKVKK